MKKKWTTFIFVIFFLSSCSSHKDLKFAINNDVFIFTDLKMEDFINKGYAAVSDSYDGHPIQLNDARFDTIKYDLSKNNLTVQITLSGFNEFGYKAELDKKRSIFKIKIENDLSKLQSFKIEGIECIGLNKQEILEIFDGERFNQYIEFTKMKYFFRFEFVNDILISISWLPETAKAYI